MPFVLFALSFLLLTLEVLETKVFAYSLENNLLFVVIAMALLGIGAGGSLVALRRRLDEPAAVVRPCLFATGLLLVLAHAWFAHFSPRVRFDLDAISLVTLALLSAPYISGGMAIAALLSDPRGRVQTLYGWNLLGSALGCVSIFVLLGPLSAPQVLALGATGCGLLGAWLCARRGPALVVALAAGGAVFAFADRLFAYAIEPVPGQLALLEENVARLRDRNAHPEVQEARLERRFDRWDPTARVQVHDLRLRSTNPSHQADIERIPSMWFTQDSSYGSPLIGAGVRPAGAKLFYERTLYGAGYFRQRPDEKVLVIGLGGAPDVQTALHHGAASVTGVDINATTIGMVREAMAEFVGRPYADPRVHLHVRDGRSFVRGARELYDHIQLSGVDTKTVLASGTLAVNESYLYTQDAFREYLERLTPEGLLCIVYAGDDLMRRLAISAQAALRELGAAEPHRHVALLKQSEIVGVLVKRTPFTSAECERLRAWLAQADRGGGRTEVTLMVYELLLLGGEMSLQRPPRAVYLPDGTVSADPAMQAAAEGKLDAWLAAHRLDLSPVRDSRPFFFHVVRHDDVFRSPPVYFQRLFRLVWILGGFALLFILGPLFVFQRRGIRVVQNLPFAVYFAALGAGFILAEIGLIHRYVLFLGHQAYAFASVIGGMLVAASLGAMLSRRFAAAPHRVIGFAVLAALAALLLHQTALDPLFTGTAEAPFAVRLLLGLLALAPLGVPLGMLFPTGLALVGRSDPHFVPWACGINGVFSVLGSTLVLPGAILYGFPAVAGAAAAVYAVAALVGVPLAARAVRGAPR
ncbi:MAG: hypothetical protein IT458_20390 [Planctomycetes bacterium]|nr:hypothetical protein [Planctomycetota bacterium]